MLCMDEIVTVDTAAVHLAGAIGHANVKLLLSYWHSWRWIKSWYGNVKICRQTSPGDWASALGKI
jgi:ADP-heptose:LPS heptosyltransferase